MSYHGLPYIISNLPKWTFTTLKDFRIGSCMWAGDMVYKFTLGMKHPVGLRPPWSPCTSSLLASFDGKCRTCMHYRLYTRGNCDNSVQLKHRHGKPRTRLRTERRVRAEVGGQVLGGGRLRLHLLDRTVPGQERTPPSSKPGTVPMNSF